jgi:hypothetical protein
MNKYEMISISVIVIVIFGGLSLDDYNKKQVDIEAIKAGLEQCIIDSGLRNKTIWVKDCEKYKVKNIKD